MRTCLIVHFYRYLVLDIADNLLENIIKFFQPVSVADQFL